jgi:hypothetical protein
MQVVASFMSRLLGSFCFGLLEFELGKAGRDASENLGIERRLHLLRLHTKAARTLAMTTFLARRAVGYATREHLLAGMALVVRHGRGAPCVPRVSVGVLFPLGRVTRTIGAANVAARLALLVAAVEQSVADVAGTADALPRLLVDEILGRTLGVARQGRQLLRARVRIRDNVAVARARAAVLLEAGLDVLAGGSTLGLGAARRAADALGAARVLALGALAVLAKGGVADVAGAADAHADRLLDTEHVALGRLPLAEVELEAEALAELAGALRVDVDLGHRLDALDVLVARLGRIVLGLSVVAQRLDHEFKCR